VTMTETVGCTDVPVFHRAVRRNPETTDNRPYETDCPASRPQPGAGLSDASAHWIPVTGAVSTHDDPSAGDVAGGVFPW
jgi:hypothetical protein